MIDRCYVLNLHRRPDRLTRFAEGLPRDWPFTAPRRFPALDGTACTIPSDWTHTPGAYGCWQSHLRILRQCKQDQVDAVLILEDDAVFCERFTDHVLEFMAELPADWEMAYLGGCLRRVATHPPEPMSERVLRAFTVFGTFAYVVRGRFLERLIGYLEKSTEHIDRWYGKMHLEKERRIYVPDKWLVTHAGGTSDIRNTSRSYAPFIFPDPITCVPTELVNGDG